MPKLKIKTILKLLDVHSLDEAHDIDALVGKLKKISTERSVKDKKVNLRNTDAKRDIRNLRGEKENFISNSCGEGELKRIFGLKEREIKQIPVVEGFGESRYLKQDVHEFLFKKTRK